MRREIPGSAGGSTSDNDSLQAAVPTPTTRRSADEVNELGLRTGQSERLRTITPHRLFLSTVAGLAGRQVESLADLLREFNHHNGVTVAYKAFYNRLARP